MLNKDKELFEFLTNAPKDFREGEKIKKYQMKNGDFIHCVLWNMHFYITGTDIVKILLYRFQTGGRQLANLKKFEEGIFSDLRNLKPGIDATLEGPRSEFLEFLYKNGCIRTQKKQKVFYWYSVPHDALFCDALERDLRRESSIQSYNKYINTLTRPMADVKGFNQKQYSLQRSMSEMESRGTPISEQNLFIPSVHTNVYDTAPSGHPQYLAPSKNSSYSMKIYPDLNIQEKDGFYRDGRNGSSQYYKPAHRSPMENKPQTNKQIFSMSDFDFLKEKSRSRSTENDGNGDELHTLHNIDDFEMFGRF